MKIAILLTCLLVCLLACNKDECDGREDFSLSQISMSLTGSKNSITMLNLEF